MARVTATVLFLSCAMAVLIAAPASASTPASQHSIASSPIAATAPVAGRLHVNLQVQRFVQRKRKTEAVGVVTATLSGINATPTKVKQQVRLQVSAANNCKILLLTLNQLDLTLLGVNVHLDRVRLSVTGERSGGVLGSLFCSLANARLRTTRAAVVSSLNHSLRQKPMRPISFGVTAKAAQAPATPTCSILDLVLGPLHLDLLGLVVDLNQVHLTITGNPAGGILGRLLCGLNNAPTPTIPGTSTG
jgi:hypothetical protein